MTARAIRWLEEESGPFFLFLNYFDAHTPFMPPDESPARFSRSRLHQECMPRPSKSVPFTMGRSASWIIA